MSLTPGAMRRVFISLVLIACATSPNRRDCEPSGSAPFGGATLVSHQLALLELSAAIWWRSDPAKTDLPNRIVLMGPSGSRLFVDSRPTNDVLVSHHTWAADLIERLRSDESFPHIQLLSSRNIERCIANETREGTELITDKPSLRYELFVFEFGAQRYMVMAIGHPRNRRVWQELRSVYKTFRLGSGRPPNKALQLTPRARAQRRVDILAPASGVVALAVSARGAAERPVR